MPTDVDLFWMGMVILGIIMAAIIPIAYKIIFGGKKNMDEERFTQQEVMQMLASAAHDCEEKDKENASLRAIISKQESSELMGEVKELREQLAATRRNNNDLVVDGNVKDQKIQQLEEKAAKWDSLGNDAELAALVLSKDTLDAIIALEKQRASGEITDEEFIVHVMLNLGGDDWKDLPKCPKCGNTGITIKDHEDYLECGNCHKEWLKEGEKDAD